MLQLHKDNNMNDIKYYSQKIIQQFDSKTIEVLEEKFKDELPHLEEKKEFINIINRITAGIETSTDLVIFDIYKNKMDL